MRLDLFLKVSRLCPRRSSAQLLCDAGLVSINNRPVKSSHQVKAGDEITIRRRDRETRVRILTIPATRQTAKKDTTSLYELLSEVTYPEEE